jgi:hypothetical protein
MMARPSIAGLRPLAMAAALACLWQLMPAKSAQAEAAPSAQTVPLSPDAGFAHPRLLAAGDAGRAALRVRLENDPAAARRYQAILARVQPYVERHRSDPAWIVSRLQMYWQAHSTQVYVKDGVYDHADGKAPAPTVRYTGGRDSNTIYATPKLEDIKPYMGENDLLYLQNKVAPGQPWEWAPQAKTGRIVEAINMRIAELARDAAFLYWYTGDEAYAAFAYDIFDTYMTGIHYRAMPVDLNHAHDQTIVGLQSYEVIHEDIVGPLTEGYDFMFAYARGRAGAKGALYDSAFKKWADVILANGVPWNNWNLIKARFVLQIAAVLGKDDVYADRHGAAHYVQAAVDGSGLRQWGLQRLLDYGYDAKTGIWNESPGYSVNVVNDYLECLEMLERVFGIDLLPAMPVLARAANALPQYLLPNGRMVGFGDTRYDYLRTGAVEQLLAHAERHGDGAGAQSWSRLLAAIRGAQGAGGDAKGTVKAAEGVRGLLLAEATAAPLTATVATPAAAVAPAPIQAYQTPTFYAPNASWLVQRNGYGDVAHPDAGGKAMAISQSGSSGNHTHAAGIAMELYALGLSLAPESGRGSGYLQNDHLQYYAQFPAHNTVVVDGASTYPSMKSDHPLSLQAVYPQPGSAAEAAFPWATFSDASFIEPATDAEQRRVLGMVRLDNGGGYFVDIFRSHRRNGKDKYHDYIYHNLGQAMRFTGAGGQALSAAPSQRLAFADGDVFGYDFWRERKSLTSTQPLTARFDLSLPDREVGMNAWLQGDGKREFFSLLAPPSTAWSAGVLPKGIDQLPLQTLVVRQQGEAWTHPFSAIFEPVEGGTDGASARVTGVEEIMPATGAGHAIGLRVSVQGGRQTIISNDGDGVTYAHQGQRLLGRYAIIAERGAALDYLFMGHGRELAGQDYVLTARQDGTSAALWRQGAQRDQWYFTASRPVELRAPADSWPATLTFTLDGRTVRIAGRAATGQGRALRVYALPAMPATRIR